MLRQRSAPLFLVFSREKLYTSPKNVFLMEKKVLKDDQLPGFDIQLEILQQKIGLLTILG